MAWTLLAPALHVRSDWAQARGDVGRKGRRFRMKKWRRHDGGAMGTVSKSYLARKEGDPGVHISDSDTEVTSDPQGLPELWRVRDRSRPWPRGRF